jgi:hypothetical protein
VYQWNYSCPAKPPAVPCWVEGFWNGSVHALFSNGLTALSIYLVNMPDGKGGTIPTYFWFVTAKGASSNSSDFGMSMWPNAFGYQIRSLQLDWAGPPPPPEASVQ